MIKKNLCYIFLLEGHRYFLEQKNSYEDIFETTAMLYREDDNDVRKQVSKISFYELCGLKEAVDEVFQDILPRFNVTKKQLKYLLSDYPWLKEKAAVNPLFGIVDTAESDKTEEQ